MDVVQKVDKLLDDMRRLCALYDELIETICEKQRMEQDIAADIIEQAKFEDFLNWCNQQRKKRRKRKKTWV